MPITLHFQAETITPLIIAGADNKNPNVLAEGLRPPSLRGAMRWWFRAMMGAIVGAHDNYRTLRSLEGRVFGVTEQGSAIRLRTYPCNEVKLDKAYLCMNDDQGRTRSGINRSQISKFSVQPPSKFLVRIDGYGTNEVVLALSSLWLTAMFGGLGNRARRGFGSLALAPLGGQTTKAVEDLQLTFSYPNKSLADIASQLAKDFKQVHGRFTNYAPTTSSPSSAKFPVLLNRQAKLWLIKPKKRFWANWKEAMSGLRDDIYRAYKNKNGLQSIGSANPREASPLIIQIKRTSPDKFFGVLLAFEHPKYFGAGWANLVGFLKALAIYEYQEVTLP